MSALNHSDSLCMFQCGMVAFNSGGLHKLSHELWDERGALVRNDVFMDLRVLG